MKDTLNNLEESYLAVWKRLLNDILGWSEPEVLAWAKKYDNYLKNPEDIFYHEDPQYWVVSALVPTAVNERLSPGQRSRLRKEILDVLGVKMYLADYLDVDWKHYKDSIDVIVEKYAS